MPQIDELFRLVKSLEPNEKRYFKLHADKHVVSGKYKGNAEKLFKQKNKGKAFIKNLAFEKNYLYGKIMEVLRSYHAENTAEGKLNNILSDIRLLYNKGLHDAALKMLEKGFELAERTENLPAMLLLFQFKHRLKRHALSEEDAKITEADFEREKGILKMFEDERTILYHYDTVYNLYTTGKLKERLNTIKTKIDEYAQRNVLATLSFYARYYFFATKAFIAKAEDNYPEAMNLYEEVFALWEKEGSTLKESSAHNRTNLGNYLLCAYHTERFEVFPEIIDKIESLPIENSTDEAEAFHIAQRYRLIYYLNSDSKIDLNKLIRQIESGLKKHGDLVSKKIRIALYINMCLLALQERKFENLVDLIGKTFTLIGRSNDWRNEMRHLKFFEMMAQCSLENYELLDYLVRNNERWLIKNNMNNQFTSTVLNIFRAALRNEENIEGGQLTTVSCPPDTQMLRELTLRWIKQNIKPVGA